MSANNQTLIVSHKGKWYVFANVVAESFGSKKHMNELKTSEADGIFDSFEGAYKFAQKVDKRVGQCGEGTEYGIQIGKFIKDDAKPKIID